MAEPVELELHATSWVFPASHRLRLSLAGADWPNAVPPPAPVTLTVERDGSVLTLPVVPAAEPSAPPTLAPPRAGQDAAGEAGPRGGQATDGTGSRPGGADDADHPVVWRVVRDVLGRTTEAVIEHGGRTVLDGGTVVTERYAGTVGTTSDRPDRTWATGEAGYRIRWPEATVAATARLELRGGPDAFDVRLDLEVGEDGRPGWARSWRRRIPRRLG